MTSTTKGNIFKPKIAVMVFVVTVTMFAMARFYDETMPRMFVPNAQYVRNGSLQETSTTFVTSKRVGFTLTNSKSGVTGNILFTSEEQFISNYCARVSFRDTLHATSGKFSKILDVKPGNRQGELLVSLQTYTRGNETKTVGGDLIILWAIQKYGGARVAGHVTDEGNGRYSGTLHVTWSGPTDIHVKIGAAMENTCRRLMSMEMYGNSVFSLKEGWGIRGFYQSGSLKVSTPCGANSYIFGHSFVCNFTELNDDQSWYCGFPVGLNCTDIYSFGTGSIDSTWMDPSEQVFTPSVYGFEEKVTINVKGSFSKPKVTCKDRPAKESWLEIRNSTSGYWQNKQWRFMNCYSNVAHTFQGYRQCLSGKTIIFFGDSTVRQYVEYTLFDILGLSQKSLKDARGEERTYHSREWYESNGARVTYLKHAMPFHNPDLPPAGITSYATELSTLATSDINDTGLVLMFNYHVHLQAYPLLAYRERVAKLVTSLRFFLERKPRAKIFIKSPHFCVWDIRWYDHWLSTMYINILFEEFGDLMERVIYLDVWAISLAHNNVDLHPQGATFDSQIQQFMSYIC